MSVVQKTLPASDVNALGLENGDRFMGELRDGKVYLTVLPDIPDEQDSDNCGEKFASRWRGQFKDVLEKDFSKDPRAKLILDR